MVRYHILGRHEVLPRHRSVVVIRVDFPGVGCLSTKVDLYDNSYVSVVVNRAVESLVDDDHLLRLAILAVKKYISRAYEIVPGLQ